MHKRKARPVDESTEYVPVSTFLDVFQIGPTKAYEEMKSGNTPSVLIGRTRMIHLPGARAYFASKAAA